MVVNIGDSTFSTFTKGSHDWSGGMNTNFLKMSVLLHGAARSRTTNIMDANSVSNLSTFIDPENGNIYTAVSGEWNVITPADGYVMYIIDADEMAVFRSGIGWRRLIAVDAEMGSAPRELAFFMSGAIKPSDVIYRYVCGVEFTLPAGAAGSVARLDVAPTSTFQLIGSGGTGGNFIITFAANSKNGVFTSSSDIFFQPTTVQNLYQSPNVMEIKSPADVFGASGLTVTLRGKVRPINEG